ncbi:MAG: hypothetical protein ACYDCO_01705 [Armatimonadota bacterium]
MIKQLIMAMLLQFGLPVLTLISEQIVRFIEQRFKLAPNPQKLAEAKTRLAQRINSNPLLTYLYNAGLVELDELIESAVSKLPATYTNGLTRDAKGRFVSAKVPG